MNQYIRNPVLPGFNPDPSFLRVDEDYYLATSTFEWYPGVQIHHSRDLVNWTLVSRPLNRADLLDMRGNPDSCGIWAPCLSHCDGLFWLVYTDVKRYDGAFKDAPNYITTCATIDGNWSPRRYVNSSGFDPSLFHDEDGRKYFLNMQWNHRGRGTGGNPKNASFDGILLQEWHPEKGLLGETVNIYPGSPRGLTEAPHLFKRGGWYYLTVAEGGTGYDHAVTMARSRDIRGPYETQPDAHLMDASGHPDHPVQRTGHGQYVETHWGDVYHSFLMGRPLPGNTNHGQFCACGRETGLERCVWGEDDWLYLEHDSPLARSLVPAPGTPMGLLEDATTQRLAEQESVNIRYTFNEPELPQDFQWLRTPFPNRIFRIEDGALVLIGRESLGSWFEQSLVARRQEHHAYTAHTTLAFEPEVYQQAAGLVTYYNRYKFHALMLTHDASMGRVLTVMSCVGDYPSGALQMPQDTPVAVPPGAIDMCVTVDGASQQFHWRASADEQWQPIGPVLDASVISDEGGRGEHGSFTGTFCGVVAFDITGSAREARCLEFVYCSKL
ncbi:MAG: glycoside hydrolase family 43 protein [Granulosicoccus sp.]